MTYTMCVGCGRNSRGEQYCEICEGEIDAAERGDARQDNVESKVYDNRTKEIEHEIQTEKAIG